MGCLQGYRIEITGKCSLTRVEAQRLLEQYGAHVEGVVGPTTAVLLTGKPLSKPKKKDQDAQTYGIPTTDANQFLGALQRGLVPTYISQLNSPKPRPSVPDKTISSGSQVHQIADAQRKSLVEAGRKLMGDFAV